MRGLPLFLIGCGLAAIAAVVQIRSAPPITSSEFPGWPETFDGRRLQMLPLSEREKRFAEDFPGKIARFSDGSRELIIRWVMRETRALHPAADCFKAIGYTIDPLPLKVDESGRSWGSFSAARQNEILKVSERIYAASGDKAWTDVSSWYWSVVLDRTQAPWWAVTIAEPATSALDEK